jgi:hypothetical protein
LDLILTTASEAAKGREKLASYPLKRFCQRGNTQIWKSGHYRWLMNNIASFANMQLTVLMPKISREISLLFRQAVLIASPVSAPILQVLPFCRDRAGRLARNLRQCRPSHFIRIHDLSLYH